MLKLEQLIQCLNREELRHLKMFLQKYDTPQNRKDIALLDIIRQKKSTFSDKIATNQLYSGENRNAYYRLKNRLYEDVVKSLFLLHHRRAGPSLTANYLTLSKIFKERGMDHVALYFLEQAEKKAVRNNDHEMMDLVYSEYIRFSQESLTIDPEFYISARKKNAEQLLQLREIDDILSILIYRLRKSQNFSTNDSGMLSTLQQVIDQYSSNRELMQNPQVRIRIYDAVSRMMLQRHDYEALETYLEATLEIFEKDALFNKNTHATRLQMLTYLANAKFKLHRHKESLKITDMLEEEMNLYGGIYKSKYRFYYFSIRINNFSVLNTSKAIEIINEALDDEITGKNPVNRVFLMINLVLSYFDSGQIKPALRQLIKLAREPGFASLDDVFKLKVAVAELIIRYELDYREFLLTEIERIKSEYGAVLDNAAYRRQADMLEILHALCSGKPKSEKGWRRKARQLYEELDSEASSDQDILNYHEWLRKRVVFH